MVTFLERKIGNGMVHDLDSWVISFLPVIQIFGFNFLSFDLTICSKYFKIVFNDFTHIGSLHSSRWLMFGHADTTNASQECHRDWESNEQQSNTNSFFWSLQQQSRLTRAKEGTRRRTMRRRPLFCFFLSFFYLSLSSSGKKKTVRSATDFSLGHLRDWRDHGRVSAPFSK